MHAVENKRGGGREQMRVENCITACTIPNFQQPLKTKTKNQKPQGKQKEKKEQGLTNWTAAPPFFSFFFSFPLVYN